MGLLSTRWEGEYKGHHIVISRSEITKGFQIEWDGEVIASRKWSFVGLGRLDGTAEIADQSVEVKVVIGLGGWDGECAVTVGQENVKLKQTK